MSEDRTPPEISPELQTYIEGISAKRPKTMLTHILQYGSITTKELDEIYGYKHAPRAARDVEELGIHLQRTRIKQDGRWITKYTLDVQETPLKRSPGRRAFPKKI